MQWHTILIAGFQIGGLVSTADSKEILNKKLGGNYPLYSDFETALTTVKPDAVCISTYPDTHETFRFNGRWMQAVMYL
jgi:predicted dehydrogenase